MRINKWIAAAFAALALLSCQEKEEPQPKDTTPAELKSFALLKADNDALPADVVAEISANMVIRVPGTEAGKKFKATVTAGENDEIKVNGVAPDANGKVEVNSAAPIDIIVTNTKSELTATYEVKIGKILATIVTKVGSYTEPEASWRSDIRLAINTKDNTPYMAYARKITTEGSADKNNRIAVVKWDGNAFVPVGSLGITDGSTRQAILCDLAIDGETPYVLFYGEKTANVPGALKFDGSAWTTVGPQELGEKITATYGAPRLYFIDGKPGFVSTHNVSKTDPYRNAVRYNFNGTDWTQTPFIPGLPKYGEKGGSDGMFYSCQFATDSKGTVYAVTSNNLYGYYVFNVSNSWEMLVNNYIPEGETYGVPSSLAIKTGPDDAVYVLAPTSSKAQYQIYRYNKDAATKLETFAGPVKVNPGSSGAVKETMCFGINPTTGEIVGAYIMESKLYFAVIDENRQWTEFKEVEGAKPAAAGDSIALAFAPDGTGYIAVVAKVEDVSSIELYKIGLEADILPE